MDPEQYKLIQQAVSEGLTLNTWLLILTGVIAAGLGSYLGSYLELKGKNLATKEDFDQYLDQVKRQTEVTEKIKGEIAEQTGRSIESLKAVFATDLEILKGGIQENVQRNLESLKYELGLDATQRQITLQSQIQFRERQLSEFYGPIYALLKRIRPIDDLWTEGKVKGIDDAIRGVIRDSNNRVVEIILNKSHLIHGHVIPESYPHFLTHVAVWHAFWDSPDTDWSTYAGLPEAHYDLKFEQEIFQTTEKLKQELDDLYQQYGLRASS
jgi:hypothetical protein